MLNRNMTRRMISVFKMSIKKMVDFARLFHMTIVLSKSSKSKLCLVVYYFSPEKILAHIPHATLMDR